MSILLETNLGGDIVIDLDLKGSPALCRNLLKLVKARVYTNTLIYNVQPGRFCQMGDPSGNGAGGGCIYGYLEGDSQDITKSQKRFLKSQGRSLSVSERQEKGRVVAVEMSGVKDTIGSQFLITLAEGPEQALDGMAATATSEESEHSTSSRYLSLGVVAEDDENVLDKIHASYCDSSGRPYADVRIVRALVIHDPFEDPPGLDKLLEKRGITMSMNSNVTASPEYERPPGEIVERRIQAEDVDIDDDEEEDEEKAAEREEDIRKKEDKSRAVVLEMLGDLPSAEVKAPDNVLFVCKLNPVTDDEDLELIFSRFDPSVKAEIIRDPDTGVSLQYAFVEFGKKEHCVEAYFKMNNALVDDRRIKVDFSQSVAKVWNKYSQRMRGGPTKQPQQQQGERRPPHHYQGDGIHRGRGQRNNQGQLQNPEHGGDHRPRHHASSGGGGGDSTHDRKDTLDHNRRRNEGQLEPGRQSGDFQRERDHKIRSPERRLRENKSSTRSRSRSRSRSDSRSPSRERKRRKKDYKKRHKHDRRHNDRYHRDGDERHHSRHDDRGRRYRDDGRDSQRRHHKHQRYDGDQQERKDDRDHRDDRRHRDKRHNKKHRNSRSRSRSSNAGNDNQSRSLK